jgi:hypothetical protein
MYFVSVAHNCPKPESKENSLATPLKAFVVLDGKGKAGLSSILAILILPAPAGPRAFDGKASAVRASPSKWAQWRVN